MSSASHRRAAFTSWANTRDRTARTAPGRKAADDRFEQQFTHITDPAERALRADAARKAFYIPGRTVLVVTACRTDRVPECLAEAEGDERDFETYAVRVDRGLVLTDPADPTGVAATLPGVPVLLVDTR